jgi:TolA-binding protein
LNRFSPRAIRVLSPFVFVLALAFAVAGPARAETPDEQYQFASGLYSQKLWSLAADKLRAFVDAFPSHPRAKNAAYQLGGALYRTTNDKGDIDYAATAAAYERAISKYPDPRLTPLARFELGDAYFNLGRYDKAIAAQRAFLASNPPAAQAAQAHYWIGESLYAQNKRAEATAAYRLVLDKYATQPIAAYAQYSLGLIALDAKQYPAAANAFRAVVAKFPKSEIAPESRLRLADTLLGTRQWGAARDAYSAVAIDAGAAQWKADALLGVADASFGAKQWSEAAGAYTQALAAIKPDDARRSVAQFRLGDSHYNNKGYEAAPHRVRAALEQPRRQSSTHRAVLECQHAACAESPQRRGGELSAPALRVLESRPGTARGTALGRHAGRCQ